MRLSHNELWRAEWNASIERKPEPKPHDLVFRNTFSVPHFKNKWVSASGIFLGLKFGVFEWDRLPKEVQDAVEDYIEHKFDINLDDYPPVKSESD